MPTQCKPVSGEVFASGRVAATRLDTWTHTNQHYIPVERGLRENPKNWFRPSEGYDASAEYHYVLRIQPFAAGGYEATCSRLDLEKIAANMDAPRRTGKREEKEMSEQDLERSVQRSKRAIRYRIKSIGCDRLLTLTRRERDEAQFWSLDQWEAAWKKFVRLTRQAGYSLEYVAVPERHKKGNFHLHVAISGHIPVNIIRGLWWSCCGGRGQGNVDISMKQGMTDYKRRAGLARYVSKYIAKQIGCSGFNKKRYWPSKHKLPEPRRLILNSANVEQALNDVIEMMGLNAFELAKSAFVFPSGLGFWFGYDTSLSKPPPF